MKQNEIERNTGPSAPASPAATTFTPYVTTYNSKPALVWRNEKGILSLVTADRQKVGTNKQLPVVKELEVIDGRRSRYAITKMGYLDLGTGDFVNAKTAAAIDAFRNTYAVKHTPAPAPTPAPEPAAAAPAPTPAAVAAPAPTFSWKDWWKLKPERSWATLYGDAEPAWEWEESVAEGLSEMAKSGIDALVRDIKQAIEDYDTTLPELVDVVGKAQRAVLELAQTSKADIIRSQSSGKYWEGDKEDIQWFPLTASFPLSWELSKVSEETEEALKEAVTTLMVDANNGFEVGLTSSGEILFAKEEDEVAANVHVSNVSFAELNKNKDALRFLLRIVQERYGYHPDQLTLF